MLVTRKCYYIPGRVLRSEADNVPGDNHSEKKKKKKKKKTAQENQVGANTSVSQSGHKDTSTLKSEEKQTAGKSSQVRTFPNGLVIEELAMGKPDGKRASRGKQVILSPLSFQLVNFPPLKKITLVLSSIFLQS